MGSGTYSKDVPGRPYALLFGELFRTNAASIEDLGRLCGISRNTVMRLVFDEAPRLRRDTAYKCLRAVTLLPADRWLGALGLDDSASYRDGSWLGESG